MAGARGEELVRGVLAPLVLGGPLHPVRPLGARLGLTLGDGTPLDPDLRSRLDVARVRRARLAAPVDTLPPIDADTIAMVAALNDLLQLTSHRLGGALAHRRHARLLANVRYLCESIAPPRTVGLALGRHATLARVFELTRTDTTVSWWTGSRTYRGASPPPRLLAWPELRRVHVDTRRVSLTAMAAGAPTHPDDFLAALTAWLTRSPLTDLATVARPEPAFAWSSPSLGLIAVPMGRSLAFRAVLRQPREAAGEALGRARGVLSGGARQLAESFEADVTAGWRLMQRG